jgi:hypothetical protein
MLPRKKSPLIKMFRNNSGPLDENFSLAPQNALDPTVAEEIEERLKVKMPVHRGTE